MFTSLDRILTEQPTPFGDDFRFRYAVIEEFGHGSNDTNDCRFFDNITCGQSEAGLPVTAAHKNNRVTLTEIILLHRLGRDDDETVRTYP